LLQGTNMRVFRMMREVAKQLLPESLVASATDGDGTSIRRGCAS